MLTRTAAGMAVIKTATDGQRDPVAPLWGPPQRDIDSGEHLEKSVVRGIQVYLNIVQLQADNDFLSVDTQERVQKILGKCYHCSMPTMEFLGALSTVFPGTQRVPVSLRSNIDFLRKEYPTRWKRVRDTPVCNL